MAPTIVTAEYTILRRLVDDGDFRIYDKRNMLVVNDIALKALVNNGYVAIDEYHIAHITDAGYDRLDEIEDGK